jgi:hypothetical protein
MMVRGKGLKARACGAVQVNSGTGVSPVQMAEIAFFNQMGLLAQVLRLVERE